MLEIFTILALIILFILNIMAIFALNKGLEEILEQLKQINIENVEQSNKELKRVRTRIAPTNFSNILNGRAYDKYKNKDGLFEPMKQKGGIPLQPDKREE